MKNKSVTEADLWKKIRDHSKYEWIRLDNVNVSGVLDCMVATPDGIKLVELKCGRSENQMDLRCSQKRFVARLKGKTESLYVLRYNYVEEICYLDHLYAQDGLGSKRYTISKTTWKDTIFHIERILSNNKIYKRD